MTRDGPLVLDATVVSNFASSSALPWLVEAETRIEVPVTVQREIQRGIDRGFDFLESTDSFFSSPTVSVVETAISTTGDAEPDVRSRLDPGESAALLRAECANGLLATDDGAARSLARDRELALTGSIGILVPGIESGDLSVERADDWLRTWVRDRGYYSPVESVRELL